MPFTPTAVRVTINGTGAMAGQSASVATTSHRANQDIMEGGHFLFEDGHVNWYKQDKITLGSQDRRVAGLLQHPRAVSPARGRRRQRSGASRACERHRTSGRAGCGSCAPRRDLRAETGGAQAILLRPRHHSHMRQCRAPTLRTTRFRAAVETRATSRAEKFSGLAHLAHFRAGASRRTRATYAPSTPFANGVSWRSASSRKPECAQRNCCTTAWFSSGSRLHVL